MRLAARSRRFRWMPAEVFRARGRPTLAARRLAPSAWKQRTELRPDPIRSDTSCHEIAPALGGEPTVGCRPAKAGRQFRTISPHKPIPVRKHEVVGLCGLRTVCFRKTGGLSEQYTLRIRRSLYAHSGRTAPDAYACRYPGQGPLQPNLREEIRNPLRPRCLPSLSYRLDEDKLSLGSIIQVGHSPELGKCSAPLSDFSVTRRS